MEINMGDPSERVKLRRTVASDASALPKRFHSEFTGGELAALLIIHSEIQRSDLCDLPYRQIGEQAGVSAATVSKTVATAVHLGLLLITRREDKRGIIERGPHWESPGVNRHERRARRA
jgi:hypothetical protein